MVREALTVDALNALEPREAAARFISRRAEGLTASEQQLLADWLAQDEVNRRMYASAERAWQSFDGAGGDEILAAMRAHARAPRARTWAWRPAAAAAAVLLVAVSAVLYFAPNVLPGSHSVTNQYASARGEVKELDLPDGSHLTLDADSAVTTRFDADARRVELQRGRAYFAVAHDTSRRFTVTAGNRQIIDVGTKFDVNVAADSLTVTLLEGEVRIGARQEPGELVTLHPGEQYVERLGRAKVQSIGAAGENAVSWRSGLINFDDQPLAEAAAVMNRYSREQIVVKDPEVASMRLSGQFRAGDTERFAQTLAEIHQLRSVRHGNEIELVRR